MSSSIPGVVDEGRTAGQVDAAIAAGRIALGSRSGEFVSAVGRGIEIATTITTCSISAAGRMFASPMRIEKTITVDQVALEVTAFAAGLCRLSIYADDNGRPGTLILDAGEFDCALTNGVRPLAVSLTLTPQVVWLACNFSTTGPTLRGATAVAGSIVPILSNAVTSRIGSLQGTQTYGAAPATFPTATQGDGRYFHVQLRVA